MSGETKPAELADVIMCYRLFLHREPEGDDVVQHHLNDRPTVTQLVQRFIESQEHEPERIDRGCLGIWRRQHARDIEIDASPAAKAEVLAHVEKVWSAYGTEDPYYSVINEPKYRMNNISSSLIAQFYQSGIGDVMNFKHIFDRNQIDINPAWDILELGCGVGRIAEHFSKEFSRYLGVDISDNHLKRATARLDDKNIKNATFSLLSNALKSDMRFDIFYSVIVLQHNPPPIIYHLLDVFLSRIRANGFALFQLPCHLYGYRFHVQEYLAGRGKLDGMEMHALPQKYVFELLYKHGLQPIEVCPFPAIGPIGISYFFFARKGG